MNDGASVKINIGEPLSQNLDDELKALRARIAELEHLASRDGLTSLFNRRHFDLAVERWIARVRRYGETHFLLFVDLNNLKEVNDRYGHVVGDRLLKAIGEELNRNVRLADVAARIGGDEFGLLLEHINAENVVNKVRQLDAVIAQIAVASPDGPVRCSCAIGHAAILPDDSPESLLDRADRDMYVGKRR